MRLLSRGPGARGIGARSGRRSSAACRRPRGGGGGGGGGGGAEARTFSGGTSRSSHIFIVPVASTMASPPSSPPSAKSMRTNENAREVGWGGVMGRGGGRSHGWLGCGALIMHTAEAVRG